MKPDTEELELALGRQLRGIGRAYRPEPPDDLVRFVDTVPAQAHPRLWRLPGRRHATLVRGIVLAAAAVLVAAVVTTAIVNVRGSQSAAAGPGWSWHAVTGGPVRFGYVPMPAGFLAECGPSPASADLSPCSSRDGVNWTSGLDPAILSAEGLPADRVPFGNVQRVGDTYLAYAFIGGSPVGLFRSTDGVDWQPVDSNVLQPAYEAANYIYLASIGGQFAFVLGRADGDDGALFLSSDGLTWREASRLPARPSGVFASGSTGLYLETSDEPAKYWRSVDGVNWTRVDSPGIPLNAGTLPDGTYLSQAYGLAPLQSADGTTWQEARFDLPSRVEALVVYRGRILAEVGPGGTEDRTSPIWESVDSGKTWHELLGPDGQQLHGAPNLIGDAVFIDQGTVSDPHVGYVGFFDDRSIASAAPATPARTPTSAPTSRSVPTKLPDAVRSEWTWTAFDVHQFESPIEVPGGWVATCSAPGTTDFQSASLCTSVDGLHWQIPADPAMVAPDGTDFWPLGASHANGVYLAYSLQHWIPFEGDGVGSIWRSTDGHAWTKLPESTFGGLTLTPTAGIRLFNGQFATIAGTTILVSSDGLAWTKLGDLPGMANTWSVTDVGILLDTNSGTREAKNNWVSRDGRTWNQVSLPSGVTDLGFGPVKLADGTYVDIGSDFVSDGKDNSTLMTSTDGLTWKALSTRPEGTFMSLSSVGGRLVLNMALGQNNEGPYTVWQSADGGKTWQSLPDPEGFPAEGFVSRFGDGIVVTTTTNVPTRWLGTLSSK